MFYIGQKVVCVDASGHGAHRLHRGAVYTVSEVRSPLEPIPCERCGELTLGAALDVVEAPAPTCDELRCSPYSAERFRPAVRTDISVFTAMLNSTPADAERDREPAL